MSVTPRLPDDPGECQRLLEDLLRRNDALRRQADDARRQAEEAQRRIDELRRVLEETAADYSQLQEKHAELAETLALFRCYGFGPRRERHVDDPNQRHLFDLHDPATEPEVAASAEPDAAPPGPRPKASRPHRRVSLDHLPHIRIEHDLTEAEKTCSGCGGPKQHIGEDLSRELEFIPAKLEVKVHVLPKYACPKCRDGVASPRRGRSHPGYARFGVTTADRRRGAGSTERLRIRNYPRTATSRRRRIAEDRHDERRTMRR